MSCHVMSCRHYCIEFLKKSFSKTFLFHKIIYKYFAGFLACIVNSHYEDEVRSNPQKSNSIILDCHATARTLCAPYGDDAVIHCHYEGNARSNLFNGLLHSPKAGFSHIRNDFKFDKFQRFISVIYKKFITKGDLNYVKSQNNF